MRVCGCMFSMFWVFRTQNKGLLASLEMPATLKKIWELGNIHPHTRSDPLEN